MLSGVTHGQSKKYARKTNYNFRMKTASTNFCTLVIKAM